MWFVAVNATLLIGIIWVGAVGLFAPVIGIGGAFLSLLFAKALAIRAHGIKLIEPMNPRSGAERELLDMITDLAGRAGLEHVPAVGVYASPDLNAFATGTNQKGSLVAFTDRLLEELPAEEIRAVAAHEIAHIANRDMLAMVLLQGAINSIIIAIVVPISFMRFFVDSSDKYGVMLDGLLWLLKAALALVLTFLGSLLVKAFSRRRELRADALAARLCGSGSMIAALKSIDRDTAIIPRAQLGYAAFKIAGGSSWGEWFSTHPSMARRIANLDSLPHGPVEG
ncbi:M48 family metalloprotease [Sphingomonas rhizophila]|uniref:M48 family metalloprotease n=1 Tax=Sphingomonas rhizophila TaxID=2071607 RepID=A0A7G9SC97_9SPHN|nr:zinc metalloprotease HtpX [Sphingomonas rhizophila]QNN65472.1 M48 family metalloprotease [Sphingomonas rhizophila]